VVIQTGLADREFSQVLLADGGFKHGTHLSFDTKNNHPLPNMTAVLSSRSPLPSAVFFSFRSKSATASICRS
jgi:hypothetical protein